MKLENNTPNQPAPPGRRKTANKESIHDIDEISDISHLQLFMLQQLQKSLDSDELLNLYKDALPSSSQVNLVSFLPKFQTQTSEAKASIQPNTHKIKLFAGDDYIGILSLEFNIAPSAKILELAEETSKLIAFPLLHSLEYQQAVRNSELDALTNLKNRKAMNQAVSKACNMSKRYNFPISILMLDIDHFKKVNDTYGHIAGDKVLQKFALLVQQSCRLPDDAFRFGGEEFLMLLPNTDHAGAFEAAERLRKSIEINDLGGIIEEKDLPLTTSIGIATHIPEESLDQFLERADKALYAAKTAGRNRSMYALENVAQHSHPT